MAAAGADADAIKSSSSWIGNWHTNPLQQGIVQSSVEDVRRQTSSNSYRYCSVLLDPTRLLSSVYSTCWL